MREEVIWAENRDEIFINRLAGDIDRLRLAGFSDKEIKDILGTFKYIHFWLHWPDWAWPVDKLPNGLKWSDAQKFNQKATSKSVQYTFWFLIDGEDLYIRGRGPLMVGLYTNEPSFLKVVGFRNLTAREFLQKCNNGPFFEGCVLKIWKDNGLRVGLSVPKLRDLK